MTVLEQNIEINVVHCQSLLRFDIIQTLKEDGDISFKVLHKGEYVFTLIARISNHLFKLELSDLDRELDVAIDWPMYYKIKISLYSVFINEEPS